MNPALRAVLWLFDPRGRIGPRTYLRTGMVLAAVKYAGDAAAVGFTLHRLWRPSGYLDPLLGVRANALADAPNWLLGAVAAWAAIFLFAGVSLTVRRLADAGRSPWWAFFFIVPYANYVLIAACCLMSTAPSLDRVVVTPPIESASGRDALVAIAASLLITIPTVAVHALVLRTYSGGLFLGTPFSLGAIAAYFYNWKRLKTQRATFAVAALALVIAGFGLLGVALEGMVCILMASPLALAIALAGAVIGRQMAIRSAEDVIRVSAVIVLGPLLPAIAPAAPPAVHEVRSVVEVDAPPAIVWRHVVAFGDLTEPPGLLFRLGVAYPLRATIEGTGVGAVRHCVFSTGTFVEPITAWDAPRRLAFDVVDEPPPMRELSPYAQVHAPHLDGFLRSRRGEFRLEPLPGGRTRLTGSTWYTVAMEPLVYWQPFADFIIHRIHLRVLRHVGRLSEADREPGP